MRWALGEALMCFHNVVFVYSLREQRAGVLGCGLFAVARSEDTSVSHGPVDMGIQTTESSSCGILPTSIHPLRLDLRLADPQIKGVETLHIQALGKRKCMQSSVTGRVIHQLVSYPPRSMALHLNTRSRSSSSWRRATSAVAPAAVVTPSRNVRMQARRSAAPRELPVGE
jgi:hypothetical protein